MSNANCQVDQCSHEQGTCSGGTSRATKRDTNVRTFEEALAETGFGKLNYFLMIVAGNILGTVLFETLGLGFVLPVSDCDLHLTTQQKGMLSAIGFIGIITSSHLWGFLADTKGRRRVIRPTLQIAFGFTVISSFLGNFWALLIFRFLNGFFVSGSSATIYAYLGEFHSDKARSKAIMGASVVFGIAAMLMPALAWLVINNTFQFYIPIIDVTYKPWRLFMIVCGLPGLLSSLCLYIIPESPKYTLANKGSEEAIIVLKKVYAMNTGNNSELYSVTHVELDDEFCIGQYKDSTSNPVANVLKSMWRQTSPLFQRTFIRQTTLGCLLQFISFITANGMYMWLPHILDEIGTFRIENPMNRSTICQIIHTSKIESTEVNNTHLGLAVDHCRETLVISVYQSTILLEVGYIASFALIGFIINVVGKIPIMFVIMVGTGACSIALIYVNILLVSTCLFIGVMMSGLSTVVMSAAIVDLFPTNLRAMAVCITLMVGRLGSVVGANIIGVLLDYNCQAAFAFSGSTLIVGGFLGFLLPEKYEAKKQTTANQLDRPSNESLATS